MAKVGNRVGKSAIALVVVAVFLAVALAPVASGGTKAFPTLPRTDARIQVPTPKLMAGAWFNITIAFLGWNFISSPLILGNSTLPNALNDLAGGQVQWDRVMTYRNGTWIQYNRNWPKDMNSLTSIDNRMGLVINITSIGDGLICVGGSGSAYPTTTLVNLRAGWNMMPYPSSTPMTVQQFKAQTGVSVVEDINGNILPPTYVMHAGEAYWVFMNFDTIWTVNW